MTVQADLCGTGSESPKTSFLVSRLNESILTYISQKVLSIKFYSIKNLKLVQGQYLCSFLLLLDNILNLHPNNITVGWHFHFVLLILCLHQHQNDRIHHSCKIVFLCLCFIYVSPPTGSGDILFFPVRLSVCLSVCPSVRLSVTNRVRSIT